MMNYLIINNSQVYWNENLQHLIVRFLDTLELIETVTVFNTNKLGTEKLDFPTMNGNIEIDVLNSKNLIVNGIEYKIYAFKGVLPN